MLVHRVIDPRIYMYSTNLRGPLSMAGKSGEIP